MVVVLLSLCSVALAQELSKAQTIFGQGYAYHTGDGVEQNYQKAVAYYRQALQLDPKLYEAQSNAGNAYYALEKYQKAKYHFGKAIEIARERPDISHEAEAKVSSDLASCYFQTGHLGDSEKWLRAAIRKYPGLVEAHYNLINLLLKRNRRDEAKVATKQAMELAPSQRYDILTGRLEGKESWDEWNPLWVKVVLVALIGGLVGMFALRALKSR